MNLRLQCALWQRVMPWKFFSLEFRAYLGGVALAAMFVKDATPEAWSRLSYLLFIPFFLHLLINGIRKSDVARLPAFVWVVIIISALHLIGLLIGPTEHHVNVLSDVIRAFILVCIFLFSRGTPRSRHDMVAGFFFVLTLAAVAFSALALIKAAFLERGFVLSFLMTSKSEYPGGSSLRSDYNMFGMTLVVAAIGLIRLIYANAVAGKRLLWPAIGFTLVITAALLAGSRRTLLVGIVVISGYWLVLSTLIYRTQKLLRETVFILAVVSISVLSLTWVVDSSANKKKHEVLDGALLWSKLSANSQKMPSLPSQLASTTDAVEKPSSGKGITVSGQSASVTDAAGKPSSGDGGITVRDSDPGLILDTMQPQYALGFQSRIERWLYATRIILEGNGLGNGFTYHELFACRFVSCGSLDYPHMPILSELLSGGVLGGVAGFLFFVLIIMATWEAGQNGWKSGVTPAVIAVFPFALISGDTVFSIPQFLTIGIIVYYSSLSGSNAESGILHSPRN